MDKTPPETILTQNPILPKKDPEEKPLFFIMTIMAFLTGLTLLISLIGMQVNANWQSQLSGSLTVQIMPQEGQDIYTDTETARDIIQTTVPDATLRVLSDQQAQTLLEPWLGSTSLPEGIIVPQIIEVEHTGAFPSGQIGALLTSENILAEIDDHQRWQDKISKTWRFIQMGLQSIILLIFLASIFVSSYATQSVLRARRNIIDVLSHVGAQHGYVARLFLLRFFSLGIKAACLGCFLAFIVVIGFVSLIKLNASLELPVLYPTIKNLMWLIALAGVIGLISAVTAGFVTLGKLRRDHRLL